ncbi:hypothetical protein SCUCBS95973_002945 [Sporothrix curviconia]|uniref:Erythromycin biosynthesis protein CIII-like C-terminal domain-containing protein n=1 Tax=Sporothrix curviconia TaxID=1260050 RepID=A0ABP0BC68_9PEZI
MTRPILLFCCHPLTGHITPVLRIAAGLHQQRGWRVAFLSSALFRARIEAAGLQFLPLVGGVEHLDDNVLFDRSPLATMEGVDAASGLPQSVTDSRHQTLYALPGEWASLRTALQTLSAQAAPGERILVVSEAFYYGAMPLKANLALLPPAVLPVSLCVSITAPAIRSVDLPPFGNLTPFDQSPAGRERAEALWDEWCAKVAPLTAVLQIKLEQTGVRETSSIVFMGGSNYTCHDAIAQTGVPSFEFPRSDMPAEFRIVGVAPPVVPAAPPPFAWWSDVATAREQGRRVVVVAQGTVETEPTELILPTLCLLADTPDVLTVAVLGVRGASLQAGDLPRNSRVADYLSYDAILPYASLWVHNGGYGATMHGIAHGVPMVLAGDTQDKPENGKRVAYCGVGVDLQTAHPTDEALGAAMREVLGNPRYAATAKAMQAEAAGMDCVGNVEDMILALIAKAHAAASDTR